MPVFRINIVFANHKRIRGYHIVEGIELNTYYRHLLRSAQRLLVPVVLFDVVQVSEFSREAKYMRENNLKRMAPYFPDRKPNPVTGKRRRRL